jgi:hypothetical protein
MMKQHAQLSQQVSVAGFALLHLQIPWMLKPEESNHVERNCRKRRENIARTPSDQNQYASLQLFGAFGGLRP